jgi:hypothetical protein
MPTVGTAQFVSQGYIERDDFGRFMKKIERGGEQFLDAVANDFENRARRYAPVRTGRLRASIRALVSGQTVYVVSNVDYARHMEYGTRPHPIPGVTANFRWRKGWFVWNDPRYGPYGTTGGHYENWDESGATVQHPGTRAYLFFTRAYREVLAEAPVTLRKAYN